MFPRLVETAVTAGLACKRGTADRQVVPATDATAPNFVVFGEEADVAAGLQKAAGVVADVCYFEDEREAFVKLGGPVTEGDPLVPMAGSVFAKGDTAGQYYAAIAARSGVADDVIPVLAMPGLIPLVDAGD